MYIFMNVAAEFPKTPSPKPARIPPQTPPAGGKSAEAGRIHSPRQIVSPCRVHFNHLDFARNSFEFWRRGREFLPRLKLFRQKVLSGHHLAVLRTRKTSLRRSNPSRRCIKHLLSPSVFTSFQNCGGDVPKLELIRSFNRVDKIVRDLRRIHKENPTLFDVPAFAQKIY